MAEVTGLSKTVKLVGTSLFAVLTTDAAYTPTSAAVKKVTITTRAI